MQATGPHYVYPDRVRLPLSFDAARLVRDLDRLTEVGWTEHFVTQNYDGGWSAIPLRAPAGETHPIRMIYSDPAATHFVDTPFLDHAPYCREVLEAFQCALKSARLMRLTPGSLIKTHRDHDLAVEHGTVRLHVPVTTSADVDFRLNGTRVAMAPGEAWYVRLSDPHSVANRGTTDRVHLVIDADANEWFVGLLRDASVSTTTKQLMD